MLVQLYLNKRIPEATRRPRDHCDETQVIGLLRKAVELIEITGKDTRTAMKMARTLDKISQASAALGGCLQLLMVLDNTQELRLTIVAAHMQSCGLSSTGSSNPQVSGPLERSSKPDTLNDHRPPHAYLEVPTHLGQEQSFYSDGSNGNVGSMNHFVFDDSTFADLELWSLPDPNIFAELGGFDPDLSNLMAG